MKELVETYYILISCIIWPGKYWCNVKKQKKLLKAF